MIRIMFVRPKNIKIESIVFPANVTLGSSLSLDRNFFIKKNASCKSILMSSVEYIFCQNEEIKGKNIFFTHVLSKNLLFKFTCINE